MNLKLKFIFLILKINITLQLIEKYNDNPQYFSQSQSDANPALITNIPAPDLTGIQETAYSVWFKIYFFEKKDLSNLNRIYYFHIAGIYNVQNNEFSNCLGQYKRWSALFYQFETQQLQIFNYNDSVQMEQFIDYNLKDLDGQWVFLYQGQNIATQKGNTLLYLSESQTEIYRQQTGITRINYPLNDLQFVIGNCGNFNFMGKYFNPQLYYGGTGSSYLETQSDIMNYLSTVLKPDKYQPQTQRMFYQIQGNSEKIINDSSYIDYDNLEEFSHYNEYAVYGWYKMDSYGDGYNEIMKLTQFGYGDDANMYCGTKLMQFYINVGDIHETTYSCLQNTSSQDAVNIYNNVNINNSQKYTEWLWVYQAYNQSSGQYSVYCYYPTNNNLSFQRIVSVNQFKALNPRIIIGPREIFNTFKGLIKNVYISLGPGSYQDSGDFSQFRDMTGPLSQQIVITGTPQKFQFKNNQNQDCEAQCESCTQSVVNCTTCTHTTNRSAPECDCDDGYFGDLDGSTCTQCASPCFNCRINNNKCISCIANHYFNPSDYSCNPCSNKCNNCTNSISDCVLCSDTNRDINNNCNCIDTFYDDNIDPVCQSCVSPCLHCLSNVICLNCIDNHYYDISNSTCILCSHKCNNCTNSIIDCVLCSDTNRDINNNCNCIDTFYDDNIDPVCQSCVSPCLHCLSNVICLNCIDNHYYDISNNTCILCSHKCNNCTNSISDCVLCSDTNRDINNNCNCIETFYDDNIDPVCQSCVSPCLNCQSNVVCLSCINNYYYDISNNTCILCSHKCNNCTNSISDCVLCSDSNRDINNNCNCIDTFYDNNIDPVCQSCVSPCLNCSSNIVCLSCIDNHYFDISNNTCTPCNYKCNNCINSTIDCLSCSDFNRDENNSCNCMDTFYYQGINPVCQSCLSPCLNCSSNEICLNCIENHYYNSQNNTCTICDYKCNNCNTSTTDCVECSDITRDINSNCSCKLGYKEKGQAICCKDPCNNCLSVTLCIDCIDNHYYNSQNKSCTLCSYKCYNCTNSITDCNTCAGTGRNNSNSDCNCLDTLFDDGSNPVCQNCVSPCKNCLSIQECLSCIVNHLYNSTDKTCIPCSHKCNECSDTVINCQDCSDSNRDINQNCNCIDTFYNDGTNPICQSCIYPCINCISDTVCLSCHDQINRHTEPSCLCLDGYYEDSQVCKQCHKTCNLCTLNDGCLENKCKQNRQNNGTNLQCICEQNGISIDHLQDYSKFLLCSTCEEAGYIQDLIGVNELKMQFFFELLVNKDFTDDITEYNNNLCLGIFENQSRIVFGALPLCKIVTVTNNGQLQSSIYIQFSYIATYIPNVPENAQIQFKKDFLQRKNEGCPESQFLNQIELLEQTSSFFNVLPIITIGGATKVLYCQDLQLNIIEVQLDGYRDLKSIEWVFTYENNLDQTNLIDSLNTNFAKKFQNKNNILVPKFNLQENGKYILNINFENYLGMNGSTSIEINVGKKDIAKIEFVENLMPLTFEPWEQIQVDIKLIHQQCQNGNLINIQDTQLYYKITEIDNLTNNNIIKTIEQGLTSQQLQNVVNFNIQQYKYSPGSNYFMNFLGKLSEQDTTGQTITLQFKVKAAPLFHFIEGGSRLQSYSQNLNLLGVFKDLNVPEDLQQQGFVQEWSCTDLNNNIPCKNVQENLITFNQTESSQNYPEKFYNPFVSYEFQHKITKNSLESIEKIVVTVVEMDSPSLALTIPEQLLLQTVNLNDQIQLEISYPKNPDDLTFSAILIYELDKVAIKPFFYTKFSFKIRDLFEGFVDGKTDLVIKISCYDLEFLMPAVSTFKVTINLPPYNGQLQITPTQGISIDTLFTMEITGYTDNDFPLSYKFQYYKSVKDKQSDILNGLQSTKLQRISLTPFQNSLILESFLPSQNIEQDNQGQDVSQLIIEIIVQDSKGATTNTTQSIQVTQDSTNLINQVQNKLNDIDNYQESKQQSQLSIITQELIQYLNLNNNNANINNNQQPLLLISNKIYEKLKVILPSLTSAIEQEQNKKATVQILEVIDDVEEISEEMFTENFENIQNSIQQINQEFNNISQQTLAESQNTRLQKKKFQNEELLAKNLEGLDQISKSTIKLNKNKNLNDTYIKEQINQQNQQIVDNIKLTGDSYAKILLPNSEVVSFNGKSIKSKIQKSTFKPIQNIFQSILATYIEDIQDEGETNLDQDGIYNTQHSVYNDNSLFANTPGFNLTQQFTEKIIDMDIFKSDSQISQENMVEVVVNKTLDFEFGLVNEQNIKNAVEASKEPVCQQKTIESWESNLCQTLLDDNLQLICRCKQLTAVSTGLRDISQVSQILDNKLEELQNSFSQESLSKALQFEYYKSIIFYSFLLSILIQILVIINGYKKDKQEKILQNFHQEIKNISQQMIESNQIIPLSPLSPDNNSIKISEKSQNSKQINNQIVVLY